VTLLDPLIALLAGIATGWAAVLIWPNPTAAPWPWVLAPAVAWVVGDLAGCVLVARERAGSSSDGGGW
jgi:hypothetical protein